MAGTALTGLQQGSSYAGLLKTTDNLTVDGTLRTITDGLGADTALQVSTAGIKSTGTLEAAGASTLTGNTSIGGTLGVTGATTVTSLDATTLLKGKGTTTNNDAASTYIGEYVSAGLAEASAISITTATDTNITSISLTAGDWEVWGEVYYDAQVACAITVGKVYAGISTTSATMPSPDSGRLGFVYSIGGNGYDYLAFTPRARLSLSGSATVYLVANCAHNAAPSVSVSGHLRARRMR